MYLMRSPALVATALLAAVTSIAQAGERAGVIALSGQAAPVGPGVTFESVDYPAINHVGQVVFHGKLSGQSVTPLNDTGYFLATSPSSVKLAAREGSPIENHPGGMLGLSNYWPTSFNDAGQIAFRGSVTTVTPVYTAALFLTGPGGGDLRALAVSGKQYPDGSGGQWGSPLTVSLNSGGIAAVGDYHKSIWSGNAPETLKRLAQNGDKVGPETIHEIRPGQVYINSSGMTVFDAQLTPDGTAASARGAVLASLGTGDIVPVFKAGQPAPGAPPETVLQTFTLEGLSRGGQTLVHAALAGPGITSANDRGLWLALHPASMAPIDKVKLVQEGDPAPGLGPDARFTQVYGSPILTGDGRAVFQASVGGAPSGGGATVWEARPGAEPRRIIGVGDTAAGLPAGVTVQSIYYPAANAAGQATFGLSLTGTGIGQPNHQGIIGYDPSLGRVLLARVGDEVEVAPGAVRTIKQFGLSAGGLGRMAGGTGHDGLVTPLNDDGLLSFQATFTDGSQAILTVRVPVAGDATNDGIVDGADFVVLFDNFGKTFEVPTRSTADFDLDGRVGFADFQMLERNFGRVPPGMSSSVTPADFGRIAQFAATVPEPGGLALLGLVVALGCARRRAGVRSSAG